MRGMTYALGMFAVLCCTGVIQAGPLEAVRPDSAKQLLLDERVIHDQRNVQLELGKVEKFAFNPTLRSDRPWENALNNLYPNVAVDPAGTGLKLWYKCVVHDAEAIAKMANPTTIHDQGWYLLFAESRDGKSWQRRLSPRYRFAGEETNAVCQDVANAGVLFDPQDAEESRRYKMIYDVGHGELRVRFSPDGLDWSAPVAAEGFGPFHGDTHSNAFWDERSQRYVLITRAYYGERLVARSESRDFIHWERPEVVLRSTLEEGKNTQLYCLPAFPYANGYVGYATMYNVGGGRTVDVELAYSSDSVNWRRVLPGRKLIPRGAAESYDSGCIYPPAGAAIQQNGKLLLVYGGSQAIHKDWKRSCEPCLAELPLDGFAGFRASSPQSPGIVSTQPLLLVAPRLRISAAISQGSVMVTLKSGAGVTNVSTAIAADAADAPIEFPGFDLKTLVGAAVELEFQLSGDAQIFSVSGVELLPAPIASTGVRQFTERLDLGLQSAPLTAAAEKLIGPGVVRYTTESRPVRQDDPVFASPLIIERDTNVVARTFYRNGEVAGAAWTAEFRRNSGKLEPLNPPRKTVVDFSGGLTAWRALDQLSPGRDQQGAFVTARRDPGYGVFLIGNLSTLNLAGDWRQEFQSSVVEISFQMRSPTPGSPARLELAPPDLPGWHFQGFPPVTSEWSEFATFVDLTWNDAEAHAAGWVRSAAGFSWQETLSHVGTLVIGTAGHPERSQIDVANLRFQAMERRE